MPFPQLEAVITSGMLLATKDSNATRIACDLQDQMIAQGISITQGPEGYTEGEFLYTMTILDLLIISKGLLKTIGVGNKGEIEGAKALLSQWKPFFLAAHREIKKEKRSMEEEA